MAHIIETPRLGWCWECGESWAPDMIAVRLRSNSGNIRPHICGACILKIADQVEDEMARRADDSQALRGAVSYSAKAFTKWGESA